MSHRLGLEVTPQQVQEMEQILLELMDESPAQLILLIDQSGSVISSLGELSGTDTAVLGTLIAGDLSASQEIARLTGQYQRFQLIIREGEITNTILSEAGEQLILYLQINKSIPLGWVRLRVIETCNKLKKFIFNSLEKFEFVPGEGEKTNFSDLTDDALDSMWIN